MAKTESPAFGKEIVATVCLVGGALAIAYIGGLTTQPESLTSTQLLPAWAEPGTTVSLERCSTKQAPGGRTLQKGQAILEATFGTAGVPRSVSPSEIAPLPDGSQIIEGKVLLVGARTQPFGTKDIQITRTGMGFQFAQELSPSDVKEPWGSSAVSLLARTELTFPNGEGTQEQPSPLLTMRYEVGADPRTIRAVQGQLRVDDQRTLCFAPSPKVKSRELAIRLEAARISTARVRATETAAAKSKSSAERMVKREKTPRISTHVSTETPRPTTTSQPTPSPTADVFVWPTNVPVPAQNGAGEGTQLNDPNRVSGLQAVYDQGNKLLGELGRTLWSSDIAKTALASFLGGVAVVFFIRALTKKKAGEGN